MVHTWHGVYQGVYHSQYSTILMAVGYAANHITKGWICATEYQTLASSSGLMNFDALLKPKDPFRTITSAFPSVLILPVALIMEVTASRIGYLCFVE